MKKYIYLGRRILSHRDTSDFNFQRFIVFVIRATLNHRKVDNLIEFFSTNLNLSTIEAENSIVYEQLTRSVFYHKSTISERLALIKSHFTFVSKNFEKSYLDAIYSDRQIKLWEHCYGDHQLYLNLNFKYVDRKEGLMSIELTLDEERIYHITFWINQENNKSPVLYIGALQGKLGGANTIHELTKHFFGYRPKNLILYALRVFVSILGISKIYAVSNSGFFTNTHVRLDKKLKTCLDDFWQETGGIQCQDKRFFEIPIIEKRKGIEQVKPHKRNLYRQRYTVLDEVETSLIKKLNLCTKINKTKVV